MPDGAHAEDNQGREELILRWDERQSKSEDQAKASAGNAHLLVARCGRQQLSSLADSLSTQDGATKMPRFQRASICLQ